ncbi:two-component system sensor histidine kinase AgrC [Ureibacillus acetophenoni]|uniref:Two-component system sensor histidine kinase AgrC n=2 Tax=Ureibacillus acetophenoni TaxID=614649 RepID=A0A285USP6_9BACL|nr:two-component system sensor histidine kinase AgrC [Ureibacillus acetophenoni]
MVLPALPLIEVIVLFFTLFYTLHIIPTYKMIFICATFIFIPSIGLQFLGYEFITIAYISICTLIFFNYASKSIRAFVDMCSLVFGGIITEHIAFRLSSLLVLEGLMFSYIYISLYLVTFFTFTYYYKKFILRVNPTIVVSVKSRLFIVFTSALTITLLCLNSISLELNQELIISRVKFVLEGVYFFSMIVLYRTSTKRIEIKERLERLEIENKQHMNYMNSLEKINKEMQKFQHDYSNILLSIRGYLETDNLPGLKHYFQSHILKAEQNTLFKNEAFNNLDNLKLVELKGLLATKVIQADQLGIRLVVEIPEPIDSIDMDIIDLTRIIGILTDNAIEACSNQTDPQISIAFMKTNNNSTLICIDNTVEEFKIQLDDIYKENFSTKGKNRGIGLNNVKDILKNYDAVDLTTQVEDGWFMQELEISIKKFALSI